VSADIGVDIDQKEMARVVSLLAEMDIPLREINDIAGNGVAEAVRDHLAGLDASRPNKLGGKRQNFYGNAAESVTVQATEAGAVVAVTQLGFALRFYGGTVKPVNAKALAIPATAAAYGIAPREAPVPLTAFFFKGAKAVGALKDEGGRVWFWLARESEHKADDSLLPSTERLTNEAVGALSVFIDALQETSP
jgi:hypothetical protein